MCTRTQKQIKEEAGVLATNESISKGLALEKVAKKYGYKNYNVLSAIFKKQKYIEVDAHVEPINPNVLGVEFDNELLDRILEKGVFSKDARNDISVLSWSKILRYDNDNNFAGNFNTPFIEEKYSDRELSFKEKVAQTISMLGHGTEGWNTRRGSSYDHRDYVTSDFDGSMLYSSEGITQLIDAYFRKNKARIRVNASRGDKEVFFCEFDFEKEETTLYIKSYGNEVELFQSFFKKCRNDLILPFVFLAFPFYNVSKIVLWRNFENRSIEITKKGTKNITVMEEYFRMWYNKALVKTNALFLYN